jgi:hypothetical protein
VQTLIFLLLTTSYLSQKCDCTRCTYKYDSCDSTINDENKIRMNFWFKSIMHLS